MNETGNREQGTGNSVTETASAAQVVTEIAPAKPRLTLAQVRAKLDGQSGKRYWQSLDELADTPGFREMLEEEFPRQAGYAANEWVDAVSRRGFLKVMGASLALAGMAGCTKQPDEPIMPYVKAPEDLILGKPMYFASAFPFPTGAIPVLVKTDAFRPIKVDGNPDHPMSKGKSDVFTQGTLLDLYDPDRSKDVKFRGETSQFSDFRQAFSAAAAQSRGGQGIYFLSETITSPTLAAQWKQVQQKYPQVKLVQWEPVNRDSAMAASKAHFGSYTDAQYKLENADVILSLDADFLGGIHFPGFLPLSAAYAARHRYNAEDPNAVMNRMYAVETMGTVTGFKAEHRLALKPSEVVAFAQALASGGQVSASSNPDTAKFFAALSADLKKANGRCVVIPGEQAPAAVHLAAYQLNQALGAVGKTVVYTDTVNPMPSEQVADLKALVGDMDAGKVRWLVMLGVNPVYSAPPDLEFRAAFNKVPTKAHLGTHFDETGIISEWHINKAHYLESWSDARAYDGTISIVQPMIEPLYGGHSAHEVLQALLDNPELSAYSAVQQNAQQYIKGDFAVGWRKALHDGWVDGTAFTPKSGGGSAASIVANAANSAAMTASQPVAQGGVEIHFRPDPSLYDGRFANVGWLQELPKQVTRLSWDNAAMMSLNTAESLGVEQNDAIKIEVNGRSVIAPVLVVPGHANGSVTVHLGSGRGAEAGRVGAGVGFNAYLIRFADAVYAAPGKLSKTGGIYDICVTQVDTIEHRGAFAQQDLNKKEYDKEGTFSLPGHEAMERAIIRYATLEEAKKEPNFAHEGGEHSLVDKVGYGPEGERPSKDESLSGDKWKYDRLDVSSHVTQNAWAMAIDLNSCTGCNACVTACYAENNIPVVGREQAKIGRIMQWIRIDTYFEGDLDAPRAHFQPMACQHCENAGCELVCPVGATVHTPEGLNMMVYNRCVGTRYCSNNCVYKVRRFNFLLYSDTWDGEESKKFMRNPDVTVRSRGVMEKCTYCVQRIEVAKIEADKENRAIRDGEIVTACQQACPTDAILFGNMNDPNSKVAKRKATERDYQVLADLNFKPRTTYTAGVINPNPELA
ncbi:MAG TPA: TAT-variant-translocated molybdopterin oxidoreductase [Acidobacteriaceae bacterium]|jgi:molybdopterin-containing oxidoreductase family iron-sulfur binding subunit|nr:TAT-variant-translocated molybdopterin oxidoreductase [Acidobacteriaceae bacterium]